MSVKLSSIKVDLERELKGDWVESLVYPGVRYNVSSLFIPAYVTARQMMTQRVSRKYKGAPCPPEIMHQEVGALIAKHILHDWEDFDEPFSPELGLEVMINQTYRNLAADIEACAARLGEPDIEYVKAEGKNSGQPSAGI